VDVIVRINRFNKNSFKVFCLKFLELFVIFYKPEHTLIYKREFGFTN